MNLKQVNRLRVAVVAAASLFVGACAAETPSDGHADEALGEAESAACAGDVCEDAADDAYDDCMRLGYAKPKTEPCAGPQSASKPKWCAGLLELCGKRPLPLCTANYAPALDPTCDEVAAEAERSCQEDCEDAELPVGSACVGTIDGEIIVVGTVESDGWCRDDIGNGVDCTYGEPAECTAPISV